jgi:hypothetical protein
MLDCEQLADEIAGLSARLNAATHQLLTHIRAFDELGLAGTGRALKAARIG